MCEIIDELATLLDYSLFEEFKVIELYNLGDSISADVETRDHPAGKMKRLTITVEEVKE